MSIERIVNPIGERDLTLRSLESTTRFGTALKQLSLEFCHTFGVKVGVLPLVVPVAGVVSRLTVFTPRGIPCGEVSIGEDKSGLYYMYKSPTVKKEKASARAERDTRESSKIQSLITAIKRNNEEPCDAVFIDNTIHGVDCAMRAIVYGSNPPRIEVDRDVTDELVKHFLGHPSTVTGFRGDIEAAYDAYRQKIEANSEKLSTAKRFAEGYRAIGILRPNYTHKALYLLADGMAVGDSSMLTIDRVVEDFSEHPDLAAASMMIRTYMDSKGAGKADNLFNVNHADEYYDEIDVATGYNRSDCLWVLLPKRHG